MDNFDYESLEKYIRKYKRNIVNKLENFKMTENEMRNQSDLLCMVLDYSPRVVEERKLLGKSFIYNSKDKYKIKTNSLTYADIKDKANNQRSLILEKINSNDESSSPDDENNGTIKLSRLSSKLNGVSKIEINKK
jgi:hypothetical protein